MFLTQIETYYKAPIEEYDMALQLLLDFLEEYPDHPQIGMATRIIIDWNRSEVAL